MQRRTGRTMPITWKPCCEQRRCSNRATMDLRTGRLRNSSRGASDWDTRSATCAFAADKERQQLVEEQPPALSRAQALPVALDQALALGFRELRLHCSQRQAGALLEKREREAFDQTQRIEHELEGQLTRIHGRLFRDSGWRCQVVARLLDALVPRNAVGKAHLAMRAGADAEVVAEFPVVEIVLAAMARAREGGGLVVLVAAAGKRF